jgi:hypothetical protein
MLLALFFKNRKWSQSNNIPNRNIPIRRRQRVLELAKETIHSTILIEVPKQVHSQASLREGKAWGIKAVLI